MKRETRSTANSRTGLDESALGGGSSEIIVPSGRCDCELEPSPAQRAHDFWRDLTYRLPTRPVERPRFDVHEHHEDEHECFVCALLVRSSA